MTLMPEVRDHLKTAIAQRAAPRRRRRVVALATALVLAGGTGVAVSSTGVLSNSDPEPERPSTGPPSAAAKATFSILTDQKLKARGAAVIAELNRDSPPRKRSPGLPDDGHPDPKRGDDLVQTTGASKNGIALARTTGPTRILIAAGSGGICLITIGPLGGSSGCSSEQETANGNNVTASGCLQQDDLLVAGIAPDGIRTVTLTSHNGTTTRADVVNNAIAYRVPANTPPDRIPRTLSWTAGKRTIEAQTKIPGSGRC